MPRPKVPDWIKTHIPPRGWTNVFTLVPSNEHLYGTETLFGDWDGQTLLLAKDGAPTGVIRELRDKGEKRPWRHAQRELGDSGGYKTNENLAAAAATLPGGKLYGSATANLLCDDPRWSRSLPGFRTGPLHEYLKRVLEWVLESMPNVERIACLGQEAWFLTSIVLGRADLSSKFTRARNSCEPLIGNCRGKQLSVFALFHPAARVPDNAKRACWSAMMGAVPPAAIRSGVPVRQKSERQVGMTEPNAVSQDAAGSFPWTDISPSPKAERKSPVGIRKEMLAILNKAGHEGVLSQGFAHLGWRDGFRKDKLRVAMRLLANETGLTLQYNCEHASKDPFRYRIKP